MLPIVVSRNAINPALSASISLVLGAAAALKLIGGGGGSLSAALAVGELALAVVWFVVPFNRPLRLITLALFCVFLTSAAYAWANGLDCGCSGAARLPAWLTFSVDSLLVIALVATSPAAAGEGSGFARRITVAGVALTLGTVGNLSLGGLSRFVVNAAVPAVADVASVDSVSLLDSPCLKNEASELARGAWVVAFVRSDCQDCRNLMGELDRRRHQDRGLKRADGRRVLCVLVGNADDESARLGGEYRSIDRFVSCGDLQVGRTPQVINLDDRRTPNAGSASPPPEHLGAD